MSCILINCIHDIDLTNSRWIHHRTNGRWGDGTELIHNATQLVKLCGLVSFEDVPMLVMLHTVKPVLSGHSKRRPKTYWFSRQIIT